MRWPKFLASRDRSSKTRDGLVALFKSAAPAEAYTVSELAERLSTQGVEELATALAELTREHVVDQIFRVLSPKNRGGIADFERLDDVPDKIVDWRQDREVDVEPQMVRVLFRKHSPAINEVERAPGGGN